MKRIGLFILFVIGLTALSAKLINKVSDNSASDGMNHERIEISSIQDGNSSVICHDNTTDDSQFPILFARSSNIHTVFSRVQNRCMRLLYRFNTIAFLKKKKIADVTYIHLSFQSSRNVLCFVKLSWKNDYIRFCKLLI